MTRQSPGYNFVLVVYLERYGRGFSDKDYYKKPNKNLYKQKRGVFFE
jgi:hypothetical protein